MTDPTMTKTVALLPDRCPFCSEHLIEVPETKVCHRYWEHPEGECYLRTETVSDFQIERWNTRTQTDQQLREEVEELRAVKESMAYRHSLIGRTQAALEGLREVAMRVVNDPCSVDNLADLEAEIARSSLSSSSLTK